VRCGIVLDSTMGYYGYHITMAQLWLGYGFPDVDSVATLPSKFEIEVNLKTRLNFLNARDI
jgi:hypothetical protein